MLPLCAQNGTAPAPSTAPSNPPLVTRFEGVGVGLVLVEVLLVEVELVEVVLVELVLDVVDVPGTHATLVSDRFDLLSLDPRTRKLTGGALTRRRAGL